MRSGGFAGFQDHVVIEADGRATVTRRSGQRQVQLSAERLAEIRTAFDKAGFDRLEENYPAKGADLFTYRVTYKMRTVTAMDSAVPTELEPVLRILNDVIDRSGTAPQ